MGILSFLTGGGSKAAGGLIDSVAGSVRNVRNTFAKTLPPDQQAEFDLEFGKLEMEISKAQAEINKAEANSGKVFALWRPAVGWVCAIALGYQFLVAPLLVQIWGLPAPNLDMGPLMTLLLGMLGLAGLRTYEKSKNIENKH